jgi:hypothetical protein
VLQLFAGPPPQDRLEVVEELPGASARRSPWVRSNDLVYQGMTPFGRRVFRADVVGEEFALRLGVTRADTAACADAIRSVSDDPDKATGRRSLALKVGLFGWTRHA